jgi:transposase-like protein
MAEGGAIAPPAVQYGATCPSCRRTLRVTAPPNAREAAALFQCPGCETVFKVALKP